MAHTPQYFIGLMSGTSADAIDAVLVALDLRDRHFALVAADSDPLPSPLRSTIKSAMQGPADLETVASLHVTLGALFAEAALRVCRKAGVDPGQVRAIGSHGQTLRHCPGHRPPFTLQVGDGSVIAEHTGITTVADFRSRDVAAGGQGAPLVPAFHQWLFAQPAETRAVLNLGGIANLTILPDTGPVTGFDTGPANTLLDAWMMKCRHERYDRDGVWASTGKVEPTLLERLLADPYFAQDAPKSTGPEHFNLHWLEQATGDLSLRPEDVQATLAELTARSVGLALDRWGAGATRVYVCGGGYKNADLMRRLARLGTREWLGTGVLGLEGQWVEASAFAWLAARTLAGEPGNLPSVTGARRPVVLGAVYPKPLDGE